MIPVQQCREMKANTRKDSMWFFKKFNKIDKPLEKLKKKNHKTTNIMTETAKPP